MSTQEPRKTAGSPALTSLPKLEDIPRAGEGYSAEGVQQAFDLFRRHAAQLQAQLRVLQAAGRGTQSVEPTGHAVRMDALHLIRAAAEFADTIERDAQNASAAQLGRTEEEVTRRQHELQAREAEVERFRVESDRQRAEILNAAKNESRELLTRSNRESTQELQEAEAKGARLLEQARHNATEMTNSARAEVEQTLEWARAQASAVLARAQHGAEQLLTAAGLGDEQIRQVADAIVLAAEQATEAARGGGAAAQAPRRPVEALAAPPVSAPAPAPEPVASEPEQEPPEPQPDPEPEEPDVPPPPSPSPPPVTVPPLSPEGNAGEPPTDAEPSAEGEGDERSDEPDK